MSITRIAPSILNSDLGEVAGNLHRLEAGGIAVIHLDVMDGRFVPALTFGASIAAAVRKSSRLFVEAHLMVEDPASQIEAFAKAGCQRLIVHPETDPHVHRTLQTIKAAGMEAGISLNPGTGPECVPWLLDLLDLVLVMTVNPGWGGQKFLPTMLPKIEAVRRMAQAGGKALKIEVDGGMDPRTIPPCRAAGADLFVVGTGIFAHPGGIEGALPGLGEAAR